jgi:hypothetical protein
MVLSTVPLNIILQVSERQRTGVNALSYFEVWDFALTPFFFKFFPEDLPLLGDLFEI